MTRNVALPAFTVSIRRCRDPRPWMLRPLFPSSAKVSTIRNLFRSAYCRIASAWFSVEYCWCSVLIRTYMAAGMMSSAGGFPSFGDPRFGFWLIQTARPNQGRRSGHGRPSCARAACPDKARTSQWDGRWRLLRPPGLSRRFACNHRDFRCPGVSRPSEDKSSCFLNDCADFRSYGVSHPSPVDTGTRVRVGREFRDLPEDPLPEPVLAIPPRLARMPCLASPSMPFPLAFWTTTNPLPPPVSQIRLVPLPTDRTRSFLVCFLHDAEDDGEKWFVYDHLSRKALPRRCDSRG